MQTVRAATLNIWNKSGPYAARLEVIRAELDRYSPDVVGMQEVLRLTERADGGLQTVSPQTCQAAEVAKDRPYTIAYAPACDYGNHLKFGNALLSRFPIREQRCFPLPSVADSSTRSLLYAALDTPYGVLPVFVTHLNWRLHHGAVRLRQAEYIVERIEQLIGERDLPALLMGDFNAEPDSDEIRYLTGKRTLNGKSVYFTDAWVYAGGGGPGYTFDRRNLFAAKAHEPPRRIDYIFIRGPDEVFRGEPIETKLAFSVPVTTPAGPVWASDHFGLVCDIVMTPQLG